MCVACSRQIIPEKYATYYISVNKHHGREYIVSLVPYIRIGLFPSGLPFKMLCESLLSLTRSTVSVHTFLGHNNSTRS